jgi:hypothetical protein
LELAVAAAVAALMMVIDKAAHGTGALAAAAGDTEVFTQFAQGGFTLRQGHADFVIGDGVADTDVHRCIQITLSQ